MEDVTLRLSFPDLVRLDKILCTMTVCQGIPQAWADAANRVVGTLREQVDVSCSYPGEPDPPFSDPALHVGRLIAAEKKAWALSLPETIHCYHCGAPEEPKVHPWTCPLCLKPRMSDEHWPGVSCPNCSSGKVALTSSDWVGSPEGLRKMSRAEVLQHGRFVCNMCQRRFGGSETGWARLLAERIYVDVICAYHDHVHPRQTEEKVVFEMSRLIQEAVE